MASEPEAAGGVYHPRQPQQTPFYQLVERFYPQFEAVYEERYQERYGFWRPIIGTVVGKFLECGNLKHGFARVRCSKCREEFFFPFSCRVRCFCPSCHEKRALEGRVGWPSRSAPRCLTASSSSPSPSGCGFTSASTGGS